MLSPDAENAYRYAIVQSGAAGLSCSPAPAQSAPRRPASGEAQALGAAPSGLGRAPHGLACWEDTGPRSCIQGPGRRDRGTVNGGGMPTAAPCRWPIATLAATRERGVGRDLGIKLRGWWPRWLADAYNAMVWQIWEPWLRLSQLHGSSASMQSFRCTAHQSTAQHSTGGSQGCARPTKLAQFRRVSAGVLPDSP